MFSGKQSAFTHDDKHRGTPPKTTHGKGPWGGGRGEGGAPPPQKHSGIWAGGFRAAPRPPPTALMGSSESGSYGRRRPPRDSNPDLPPQGRACCRYTSGPSAGRPRTGVCHHPSGWSAVDRMLLALRHTTVVCHGVTVRRARPADATDTPTGPAPVPRVGRQCAGNNPMPRCMIRRDDRGRRLRPFPQPVGRLFPPSPRRTGARAARGDSGNSSHCWVGEPPHPAHEMGC